MTERGVEERLAALQRSGRTSGATSAPSAAPRPQSGGPSGRSSGSTSSGGAKWTLAGGAIGATLTMVGLMSSGSLTSNEPTVPQALPTAPVVIVVNQPDQASAVDGGVPMTAEELADVIPELPTRRRSAATVAEPVTKSGGS